MSATNRYVRACAVAGCGGMEVLRERAGTVDGWQLTVEGFSDLNAA